MPHHLRPGRPAAALLLAVSLAVAGCGDDGGGGDASDDTTGNAEEVAASGAGFCDAVLTIATSAGPEIADDATEEEAADAQEAFVDDEIRPAVAELRDTAPEEAQEAVETLGRALDAAFGDDAGSAEGPTRQESIAAQSDLVAASDGECDWGTVDVTATDGAFSGVPATVPAGTTRFVLHNEGQEAHSMVVLRKAEGVTETFEQLVALPEDQAANKATLATSGIAAPGTTYATVAVLEPGEYGIIDSLPSGTTTLEGGQEGEERGERNYTKGMIATFTVTE